MHRSNFFVTVGAQVLKATQALHHKVEKVDRASQSSSFFNHELLFLKSALNWYTALAVLDRLY